MCKLLDIPDTGPDQHGALQVLRLPLQAVDVFLLHATEATPDTACLVIALGSLPGDELQGWQQLLDANHALRGSSAPRFARDPQTNEAVLQHAFSLERVTPEELQAKITAMVHTATDWKKRHLGVAS